MTGPFFGCLHLRRENILGFRIDSVAYPDGFCRKASLFFVFVGFCSSISRISTASEVSLGYDTPAYMLSFPDVRVNKYLNYTCTSSAISSTSALVTSPLQPKFLKIMLT